MRTMHVAVLATVLGLSSAGAVAQAWDDPSSANRLGQATYTYGGSRGIPEYRKMPDSKAPEVTTDLARAWRASRSWQRPPTRRLDPTTPSRSLTADTGRRFLDVDSDAAGR